tara:strand:- start:314 stop:760 length:447 start_codon:yes stop_codon:yes gene_type:complete
MTSDLLTTRENLFDPAYIDFVNSDFISELTNRLGRKADLNTTQLPILENAVILFLYCFFNQDNLEDFIHTECKVPQTTAKELTTVILLALPDELKLSQSITFNYLNNEPKNKPATPTNTTTQPPTPDGSVVHTNISQDDLLGKRDNSA